MKFTVRYRNESGVMSTLDLEASDRNAAYDELRKRGVVALSIVEQLPKKGDKKKREGSLFARLFMRQLVLLLIVAVAAGAWYFFKFCNGDVNELKRRLKRPAGTVSIAPSDKPAGSGAISIRTAEGE